MPDWLILLLVLVVAVILATFVDPESRAERRYCKELKLRPPVSDEELVSRFFGPEMPPEIPIRIRRLVGTQLSLPVDRLLPDDEFMVVFGDLDFYELILEVEEVFGAIRDKYHINDPQTIRGLAELVRASRSEPKP